MIIQLLRIGRLRVDLSVLPEDILLGVTAGQDQAYCDFCDDLHTFYAVVFGFFFCTISFVWQK